MLLVHGARSDYDEWARATGDDSWGGREFASWLARVEHVVPQRRFAADELNPWLQTLLEAADEAGVARHADVNDPEAIAGVAPMRVNAQRTTRWNAAFAYLDPARGRPNLDVLDGSLVERVELSGETLRADVVVISAGAYQSPAILMRSGIGPVAELTRCAGNLAPYFHPVGTCAMGSPGDGHSIVDAVGRVHGIEGLRVIDASIMPTIPRANTSSSVMAIAEKLARAFG